jgi:3-hydroxyisobutyrate dehydrogenase
MQKITLLGLGIMGSGMAANWLKQGFDLTVYNRTRSKAEPFEAQGAHIADTPFAAAQGADIIFAMVGDDAASAAMWMDEEGALAGAKPGAVIVECSTVTPNWVRLLAGQAHLLGCEFLDSPVTGSKSHSANGQLVMFVGGEAATLEKVRPALEAVSRQINHLGPVGAGATWKLLNNMQVAVQVALLSEVLSLAEKTGLDLRQVNELIVSGASASPVVQAKLPRIAEQRYGDTDFSLRWMHKDARYALALADQLGVPLKIVQAAAELYQQAADKGLNDLDFSAVAEALRK